MLANMDQNLSWTESLGEAYMNQQKDVMEAVQVMRQHAQSAGNLNSNSQQKVKKQGKTFIIEPVTLRWCTCQRTIPGLCTARL